MLASFAALWVVWEQGVRTRERVAKVQVVLTQGVVSAPGDAQVTHWVNLALTNVGARAVTLDAVRLLAVVRSTSGVETEHEVEPVRPLHAAGETLTLDIGVADAAHFITAIPVTEGPTVTLIATVTVEGKTWHAYGTSANRAAAKDATGSTE